MLKITLPFPPSGNRYFRNVNGRMVRSREANDYKAQVGTLCNLEGLQPLAGNVCVTVDVYRPIKRGDLDNYTKILLDSLNGWAYRDDAQIVELHASRHEDAANPRVEVSVEVV